MIDPVLQTIFQRFLAAFFEHFWGRAKAFNGDELFDRVWIDAGIAHSDIAAERMTNQGEIICAVRGGGF